MGFDFLCLLATLRATGSEPHPWLVLLAYSAAGVIALIPATPGGLGIVEASLSGLLVLVGVSGRSAVLATLAYRLARVLASHGRWVHRLLALPSAIRIGSVQRTSRLLRLPINRPRVDMGSTRPPGSEGTSEVCVGGKWYGSVI